MQPIHNTCVLKNMWNSHKSIIHSHPMETAWTFRLCSSAVWNHLCKFQKKTCCLHLQSRSSPCTDRHMFPQKIIIYTLKLGQLQRFYTWTRLTIQVSDHSQACIITKLIMTTIPRFYQKCNEWGILSYKLRCWAVSKRVPKNRGNMTVTLSATFIYFWTLFNITHLLRLPGRVDINVMY
jgi:hypothetical protein